jgi:hypothetical protein
MSATQLSSVSNFDVDKIIFSDAKETAIPGSYRITIGTQYPTGPTGPLVFSTDLVYSFGIQENVSLDKPARTTGYSIPLCLWNQDGPTEHQKNFIATLEKVSDHIKRHMLKPEVKKSVKKYDLVESDLRRFSPLWYKKEDGEVVQGRGPMLYPKLMCNKNLDIYTVIADTKGNDIEPSTLIGQKCSVRACIKIESVFIGSKISLQVKVLELEVQQQGNQRQRLICQMPTETVVIESTDVLNPLQDALVASDEESDESEDDDGDVAQSVAQMSVTAPVAAPTPVATPANDASKKTPAARKRLVK